MISITGRTINAKKLSEFTLMDIPMKSSSVALPMEDLQNHFLPPVVVLSKIPMEVQSNRIVIVKNKAGDDESLKNMNPTNKASIFRSGRSSATLTRTGNEEDKYWINRSSSTSLLVTEVEGLFSTLSMTVDEDAAAMTLSMTTDNNQSLTSQTRGEKRKINDNDNVDRRYRRRGHVRTNNVDFSSTVLPHLGPELAEAVTNTFNSMTPTNEIGPTIMA